MEETLESLIDRATDPSKTQDSSEYFVAVWDRINKTTDGPQIATRYLAQKVRSVNEREALIALELIEACVKSCGHNFHQEIGKYKFLNELIKLLSTKYDGQWTAASVKNRIIELMYSWTKGLPKETKILDAYKMLKTQGVVTKDPVDPYLFSYSEETQVKPPVKDTVFDDEEKSKLLARLLKSKHPEDLQAANRLIKSMVRQDELKMEKQAKRDQDIETCLNNAKLLTEMLIHYHPSSPAQDKELMKELFNSCEKMRPTLFRLASSATEEGDGSLADILRANDDLTRVIDEYRKKIGTDQTTTTSPAASGTSSPTPAEPPSSDGPSGSSLIDLGLAPGASGTSDSAGGATTVLENELKALGIHDISTDRAPVSQALPTSNVQSQNTSAKSWNIPGYPQPYSHAPSTVGVVRPVGAMQQQMAPGAFQAGMFSTPTNYGPDMRIQQMGIPQRPPFVSPNQAMGMAPMGPRPMAPMQPQGMSNSGSLNRPSPPPNKRGQESLKSPTTSLDLLGQEFLQNQKQQQKQKQAVSPIPQASGAPQSSGADSLLDLGIDAPAPPSTTSPAPVPTPVSNGGDIVTPLARVSGEPVALDNAFVPLDTVLPGDQAPITVLDKNGIKIIFHFAKTTAELNRSDVIIVVISTMSTLKSAVKGFVLQVAVPKTMRVKLQPPSSSELPAHNPILPSAAITQVMLIANPSKEKVRLKFKAVYEVDGATTVETGEVDNFPIS